MGIKSWYVPFFAVKRQFCVVRTTNPKRADYFVKANPYIFLTSFN